MEKKISSISITAFRGIRKLELNNLSQVNVLVGSNNSGKTSVLECIRVMGTPDNIGSLVRVAHGRAQASANARAKKLVEYFSTIFCKETDEAQKAHYSVEMSSTVDGTVYQYAAGGSIDVLTDTSGAESKMFTLGVKLQSGTSKANYLNAELVDNQISSFSSTRESVYNVIYCSSSTAYYRACVVFLSDYIISESKQEVMSLLKSFDSNIEDISIIGEDVYIHNSVSGTLPLFTYGTGLQKALLLTGMIATGKNGVILIDEVDNAINMSAFREVFSWFVNACIKWNVQAFVTTHSAEALDAILATVPDMSERGETDLLRVITLRKDEDCKMTRAKVRTGQEAYDDRSNFEMELRV